MVPTSVKQIAAKPSNGAGAQNGSARLDLNQDDVAWMGLIAWWEGERRDPAGASAKIWSAIPPPKGPSNNIGDKRPGA